MKTLILIEAGRPEKKREFMRERETSHMQTAHSKTKFMKSEKEGSATLPTRSTNYIFPNHSQAKQGNAHASSRSQ